MGKLINIKSDTSFRITNKTEKVADIIIYTAIGESWFEDTVSAKSFSESLAELPSTITDINVRINSPGGDVFDGISIYNRLKQHKAKVTVYIDGLAASIASIIALAGDEVIMGEGSLLMIHKPSTGVWGNSTDLEEVINRLDDVEEQLIGIYRRKTGMDRTEIKTMLANETWLSAEEALEKGFVDSMMASDETLDIAASMNNAKWIKKKPVITNKNKVVRAELSNFKKNIEDFLAR